MQEYSINYGGSKMDFSKSSDRIAIKKKEPVTEDGKKVDETVNPDFEIIEITGDRDLKGAKDLETYLDQLREQEDVEVGTHIYDYFGEKSRTADNKTPITATTLIPNGRIYVIFKADIAEAKRAAWLEKYHLEIVQQETDQAYILQLSSASPVNPIKIVEEMQKSDDFKIAEPDFNIPIQKHAFAAQEMDDKLIKNQWYLQNHGDVEKHPYFKRFSAPDKPLLVAGADAKVIAAWDFLTEKYGAASSDNLGSSAVRIAVLDDAFELDHPSLTGEENHQIITNLDGSTTANNKIIAVYNSKFNNDSVLPKYSEDDHGTACVGVAAGAFTPASKIVGACPNASLILIKTEGQINNEYFKNAFKFAIENGADVISCSWGIGRYNFILSTYQQQVLHAAAVKGRNGKGTTICFSAGNEAAYFTHPFEPKKIMGFPTHPDVLAVGASNSRDQRSDYSCYGEQLFIVAPSDGKDIDEQQSGANVITSASNLDFNGKELDGSKYTYFFGGTSSACPLVAGICALMYSVNPNLTAHQVKQILADTANKIDNKATGGKYEYASDGHSMFMGYGRVNALEAVKKAYGAGIGIADLEGFKPDYSVLAQNLVVEGEVYGLHNTAILDLAYEASGERPSVNVGTTLVLTNEFSGQRIEFSADKGKQSFIMDLKAKLKITLEENLKGNVFKMALRKEVAPDLSDTSLNDYNWNSDEEFNKTDIEEGRYYFTAYHDAAVNALLYVDFRDA